MKIIFKNNIELLELYLRKINATFYSPIVVEGITYNRNYIQLISESNYCTHQFLEQILDKMKIIYKDDFDTYFDLATNDTRRRLLTLVVISNNLEKVKILVDKFGARIDIIDFFGKIPLYYACRYNCVDIIKYLLTKISTENDLSKMDKKAKKIHQINYDYELKDIDEKHEILRSPLYYLCINNNIELAEHFINLGYKLYDNDFEYKLYNDDINFEIDKYGNTLLHLIKSSELIKMLFMKELIIYKNKINYLGMTPLVYMAYLNDFDRFKIFFENNCDRYIRDYNDHDELYYISINKDNFKFVELLPEEDKIIIKRLRKSYIEKKKSSGLGFGLGLGLGFDYDDDLLTQPFHHFHKSNSQIDDDLEFSDFEDYP